MRGNRISKTDADTALSYVYNLKNQLVSSSDGSAYAYDRNGNRISETKKSVTTNYTFDKLNRLISASSPTMTASYVYDGNGLRTSKTVNGTTTNFINDNGSVIASITGETVTQFFCGADIGWMRVGDEKPVFYHYNLHGDTSKLTDTALKTVADYDYDAFGNVTAETASVDNPFRYCGEYLDNETGLIYLRARYYAPSIGAFVSEDPHWNTDNMIYGDNQTAVRYIITDDAKVYYRSNGTVVKAESHQQNIFEQPLLGAPISSIQDIELQEPLFFDVQRLPDIIAISQSSNLYAYAINNPLKYIDPSGRSIAVTISAGTLLYKAVPYIAAGAAFAIGKGIIYYKEHTTNKSKRNWDKHTKKRAGAPSKASKKSGWKSRSNKKKP